jgi:hypothetical protein
MRRWRITPVLIFVLMLIVLLACSNKSGHESANPAAKSVVPDRWQRLEARLDEFREKLANYQRCLETQAEVACAPQADSLNDFSFGDAK